MTSRTSRHLYLPVALAVAGLIACDKSSPEPEVHSSGPEIHLSRTSLAFTAVNEVATPSVETVIVSNVGGGNLPVPVIDIAYGSDRTWLILMIEGSQAPYTLRVLPDIGWLPVGEYSAAVTVTCPGAARSPQMLTVVLTITSTAPPRFSLLPENVALAGMVGGTNPLPTDVAVSNDGGGALSFPTTETNYQSGSGWLTVIPWTTSLRHAPYELTVRVDIAGLPVGTHAATVVVSSLGAVNSPQILTVTVTVAPHVTITQVPIGTTLAWDIAAGPDGNLYFTSTKPLGPPVIEGQGTAALVSRMTMSGTVDSIQFAYCFLAPSDPQCFYEQSVSRIASGPGGNLWICDRFSLGRIRTADSWDQPPVLERYPPHCSGSGGTCGDMAAGPDGNLWFTEPTCNRIGRITASGAIVEFPIPTAESQPAAITAGPDGNLWFVEHAAGVIGRVTLSGVITEFPISPSLPRGYPTSIAAGPDGNLWFTECVESDNGRIGRMTTDGEITSFPIPACYRIGCPNSIVAGPDGNLWFTDHGSDRIGRISTDGTIYEYPIPGEPDEPGGGHNPSNIIVGPDGYLWFTELYNGNIGHLVP